MANIDFTTVGGGNNNYDDKIVYPKDMQPGETLPIIALLPGDGGKSNFKDGFLNQDNLPRAIYVVAGPHKYQTTENNALITAENFCNSHNINVSQIGIESFSGSGSVGLMEAAYASQKYSNIPITLVETDGFMMGEDSTINYLNNENANILRNNPNFTAICVTYNGGATLTGYNKIGGYGINTYYLATTITDHSSIRGASEKNMVLPYFMGLVDELGNAGYGGVEAGYKLYKYSMEMGCFDTNNRLDPEVARAIVDFTIDKLYYNDNYKITISNSEISEKYNDLFNINHISINSNGEVSSDFQFVVDEMNKLRDQIKQNESLKNLKMQNFRDPSGIPGIIGKYVNMYFDTIGTLLTNLSLQSESIISIAQAMVDMDNDLKNKSEEITDNAYDKIQETVPEVPKEDNKNNTYNNPYGNNIQEEPRNKAESTIPISTYPLNGSEELLKDGSLVYSFEDGTRLFIKTEGDKVLDMRYKLPCSSENDLNSLYKSLCEKYKDSDIVDLIIPNNNNIEIVLNEKVFIDSTLEEIKNRFCTGGVIK